MQGHAARQLPADPRHHRRGAGEGLGRQATAEAGARGGRSSAATPSCASSSAGQHSSSADAADRSGRPDPRPRHGEARRLRQRGLPYLLLAPQLAGHARLLPLAGGAGAAASRCSARTRSGSRPSSSASRTSRALFADPAYLQLAAGHGRVLHRRHRRCRWRIALLLAVMADRVIRGRAALQTLLIWPYAVAPAVAGVLWVFLFNPTVGIVAYAAARAGHRLELPARRRPGDAAGGARRRLEAGQLQFPVLPRRAAGDPALADRGRRDRRRRALRGASGPSSSRCCRRRPSSCWSSTSSTPSSTRSAIIDAITVGRPGAGHRPSWSTRSTRTACSASTSAARRRSRWS